LVEGQKKISTAGRKAATVNIFQKYPFLPKVYVQVLHHEIKYERLAPPQKQQGDPKNRKIRATCAVFI
jgi:hypothetical protein